MNGFDYFLAYDKYYAQEAKIIKQTLQKMISLQNWSQTKFENFSQSFKPKQFFKDQVVVEDGQNIEKIILITKGRLRLQKKLTYKLENIWPASQNETYETHRAVKNEELNVMTVGPGVLIGLQ